MRRDMSSGLVIAIEGVILLIPCNYHKSDSKIEGNQIKSLLVTTLTWIIVFGGTKA